MSGSGDALVYRYESLEALFEGLASGSIPRMLGGGVVWIHPNALSENPVSEYWISEYWDVSHALACFRLSLVISRAASPQEVELRPFVAPDADARRDAGASASPPRAESGQW